MKTQQNPKTFAGINHENQLVSSYINEPTKESDPILAFTGLTQENYVNPLYLRTGMVTSIANMSFGGLWM